MTIVGTNIVETTIVKTAIMKIESGKIITDNPYPNKGKNCLYTTLDLINRFPPRSISKFEVYN